MNTGEQQIQTNPLTAESALRFSLVLNAHTKEESRIICRRVVTLLGSRAGCKVGLRHQRVSPMHVAIINNGEQLIAVDLVTKRGTLLNGLKMEHEHLNDGDLLTVAPWEFMIDIARPPKGSEGGFHPIELEITPQVVALEHLDSGRILQPNREVCVIGRLHGCDIVITDNSVSRAHALLFNYYGHPVIFDLLSRNNTLVNDVPVKFQLVDNGDILTIGESQFRVRLVGSAVAARAGVGAKAAEGTVALTKEEVQGDMIDIHATESSQRWRIAEKMEKNPRKR